MKVMKFAIVVLIMGMVASTWTTSGLAEEKSWSYGGIEYKLPVPMENVQIPPDLPEYHVVVPGDCLWFISKHYLNDPFLWPLIWEENLDTISNPHLIYPGDHVKLPGGTLVASGNLPEDQKTDEGETDQEQSDVNFTLKPKEPEPYPVTSESAIISSGLISKDKLTGPVIIGAETDSFDLARGDVVIMRTDKDNVIEPEKEYFVLRRGHKVYHPISGRYMGRMYHVVADAATLCVNDTTSSAILGTTYHSVLRGDFLVPKEEIPIPKTLGSPETDPCHPSSKKYPGTIIDTFDGGPMFSDAVVIGKGDIAYIDLGKKDGVAPGDYFTVFSRHMRDKTVPRYVVGECMIVKATEDTAVVVVTQSRSAIFIGDAIELKQ